MPTQARHAGGSRHSAPHTRTPLSAVGMLSEMLILCGLVALGYFAWMYVNTEIVVPAQQYALAEQDSARWDAAVNMSKPWNGKIPVLGKPKNHEVFGVLRIPALGRHFAYRIAENIDPEGVLNQPATGIGHYPMTQMPGAVGNVGLAAHRSGPWVTPLRKIMNLHVGDAIYLETADGWYTYRFRSLEYVLPTGTEVLDPFPHLAVKARKDRILTLTTCHPLDGTAERAVAYAVFEDYRPRSAGPPEGLVSGEQSR